MIKPYSTILITASLFLLKLEGSETNDVALLPEVTVYASRIEGEKDTIPNAVNIYTSQDISESGSKDLSEFLQKNANIHVRTMNSNPMQSQIAMRGFGENSYGRIKVVADGRDLNNVDMSPPMMIGEALYSVERIEIIHGPSPVLYGDGAVAGVINLRSSNEDYERKTRISARAGSQYTYGGNFSTKGGIAEDGIMYRASYDYLQSDGFRDHSGYNIHSANSTIRKNSANGSTAGLNVSYQNAFYEMPGALAYGKWKDSRRKATYKNDWVRMWSYGTSFDSKILLDDEQWLYLDASFAHKYRKSNWGDYNYANEYDLYEFFLSPRYVNENTVGGFDNRFTAGIDLRHDLYRVKDRSGYGDAKPYFNRDRTAFFLHDEFFLTDTLSVVAGGRIENIRNRWSKTSAMKNRRFNDLEGGYEFGAVYRPIDGLRTYLKTTRFYRSAFCDELNYTEDGETLEPESGYSVDLGGEYIFMKEFSFDMNLYAMSIDDEIFYNPYAKYYGGYWGGYNCNSPSETRRLGSDISLRWEREKTAEAAIKYSIVNAEFESGQYKNKDVPMVPNHRVRMEAGYWITDDIEIKCGYSFVSAQRFATDFKNEHGKFSGYHLFDAGIFYTPSWAEGWKASATIDNIFDRKYCDFAGWSDFSGAYCYPACGRSFMFTLSYEF